MQYDPIPEIQMLKTRIITATILLAVLLPILFFLPGIYLSAFFLLIVLLAAWEWSRLIAPGSRRGEIIYPIFGLLSTMILVWIADIGAYFVGKAFGKYRLAAQISPGKSIEGALGGLLLCYGYAVFCVFFLPLDSTLFGAWAIRYGWLPMLLMVTVLTAFSIFGDLFESQLKRVAGVKDSSHLLPGHGGVLDRVDALIPVMPIAALLAGLI